MASEHVLLTDTHTLRMQEAIGEARADLPNLPHLPAIAAAIERERDARVRKSGEMETVRCAQ